MGNEIKLLGCGLIELKDFMGDEKKIVNAARIAYNRDSGDDGLSESDVRVLKSLLTLGHTSPLEHVVFTFKVKAPIFVVRQWQRHRTQSYSELSRRYSKDNFEFYTPVRHEDVDDEKWNKIVETCRENINRSIGEYNSLLNLGVKPETARIVLPLSLMTTFFTTVNLHNLIKFLWLRDDDHAQWEIRQYAKAIKQLIIPIVPNIADQLGWKKDGDTPIDEKIN